MPRPHSHRPGWRPRWRCRNGWPHPTVVDGCCGLWLCLPPRRLLYIWFVKKPNALQLAAGDRFHLGWRSIDHVRDCWKSPVSPKTIKFGPSKHRPRSKYFQRWAFCEVVFFVTYHPLSFSTVSAIGHALKLCDWLQRFQPKIFSFQRSLNNRVIAAIVLTTNCTVALLAIWFHRFVAQMVAALRRETWVNCSLSSRTIFPPNTLCRWIRARRKIQQAGWAGVVHQA